LEFISHVPLFLRSSDVKRKIILVQAAQMNSRREIELFFYFVGSISKIFSAPYQRRTRLTVKIR
jgi:hypothetical protein